MYSVLTLDRLRLPSDHRCTQCSSHDEANPRRLACCSIRPSTAASIRFWRWRCCSASRRRSRCACRRVSTSRFNLQTAAFLDVVARFFAAELAGDFVPNKIPLPIGMHSAGKQTDAVPPMLSAALTKVGAEGSPVYPRGIEKLNDTADPVALMRNALTAQVDQNGADHPRRAARRISCRSWRYPDGKDWAGQESARAEHCRRTIRRRCAPIRSFERMLPGFRKLLAEWPTRIVMAGAELNDALPFPGSSLDTIAAWAPNHPVVDAYRAFKPMPYDAPSQALAAVLYDREPRGQLLRALGTRHDHGSG